MSTKKTNNTKGGIVITKIDTIPHFKERLAEGKITYRGLGMGKLYDTFYDLAGEGGTIIKVDGKEYFITQSEFDTFSRGSDGKMRIKFEAPERKMANGGDLNEVFPETDTMSYAKGGSAKGFEYSIGGL